MWDNVVPENLIKGWRALTTVKLDMIPPESPE